MKKNYKKVKSYYDKYGSIYDNERIVGYYSFINDIEVDAVKDYGTDKETLEIGCGTGIILSRVEKFAKKSWGIDLSSGMLKAAEKKGLNVKEANATKIPFNDKSFDIVYSFKVFAHIPEINKVIDEIFRTLKDNGTAILEFYNPYSFKFITNRLSRSGKKVYIRYDSLPQIKKLLSAKFKIKEIRGARIITFHNALLKIPVVKDITIFLEKLLSKTIFARLSGYIIVIAEKKANSKM